MKVTNATNACPIVITTDVPHCVPNTSTTKTKVVTIAGVQGNTAANGQWVATYIDSLNFYCCGSKGNGAFISSPGSTVICNIALSFALTGSGGGALGGQVGPTLTGGGGAKGGGAASVSFTAAPTVYWRDTFTDANGTGLGSHTGEVTPGGYSSLFGSPVIESNALTTMGSGFSADFDPGQASWTATINFNFSSVCDAGFFTFRIMDGFNNWNVSLNFPSSGVCNAFHLNCVGGAGLVGTGTVSLTSGVDYSLVVVCTGSSISVTLGGANVTVTDSTFSTFTLMELHFAGGASSCANVLDVLVTS